MRHTCNSLQATAFLQNKCVPSQHFALLFQFCAQQLIKTHGVALFLATQAAAREEKKREAAELMHSILEFEREEEERRRAAVEKAARTRQMFSQQVCKAN